MAHLRLVAVLALAMLAGLGVWTWLPPTGDGQAAIRQSIASHEHASSVVYYDFTRRTMRGEVLVRAALDEDVGAAPDWAQLFEFRLRQQGDAWEVLDRQAVSGPNGGPPYYYSPSTGEFTQDPGA